MIVSSLLDNFISHPRIFLIYNSFLYRIKQARNLQIIWSEIFRLRASYAVDSMILFALASKKR